MNRFFSYNRSLESLNYANCHFENQVLNKITESLSKNVSLKHLNLSSNNLSDNIAIQLASVLSANAGNKIEVLTLQDN